MYNNNNNNQHCTHYAPYSYKISNQRCERSPCDDDDIQIIATKPSRNHGASPIGRFPPSHAG